LKENVSTKTVGLADYHLMATDRQQLKEIDKFKIGSGPHLNCKFQLFFLSKIF